LSNIHLFNEAGDLLEIQDSILIVKGSETTKIQNDFALVNGLSENTNCTTYRFDDSVNAYKIDIGVHDAYDGVTTNALPNGNLLKPQQNLYNAKERKYYSCYLNLICGTTLSDTIKFYLNYTYAYDLNLQDKVVPDLGKSIRLPMTFNYNALFSNVALKSGDSVAIAQKLIENYRNFIEN
jgi:hypothetical protein